MKNFVHLLEKKIEFLPPEFDRALFKEIVQIFKDNQALFLAEPSGYIHNDIGSHNILVHNNHLATIVDFSDAACAPYIQNIATALVQSVFSENWQPAQASIFVHAYEKYNSLPKSGYSLLYDLMLARYATVIIEFYDWDRRFGKEEYRSKCLKKTARHLQKFLEFGKVNFNKIF